jgi:hypothetical protein
MTKEFSVAQIAISTMPKFSWCHKKRNLIICIVTFLMTFLFVGYIFRIDKIEIDMQAFWVAFMGVIVIIFFTLGLDIFDDKSKNCIVSDAAMLRMAQSDMIPDSIKKELAAIFNKKGCLVFRDLYKIDNRLKKESLEEQNRREMAKQQEQCRQSEQERRQGMGALTLEAFLDSKS